MMTTRARAMTTTTTRVAMFGAGDISILHNDAIHEAEGVELAGLWNRAGCTIVPDPAAKAAAYGTQLFDSPEALVADPSGYPVLLHECALGVQTLEPAKGVFDGDGGARRVRVACVESGKHVGKHAHVCDGKG